MIQPPALTDLGWAVSRRRAPVPALVAEGAEAAAGREVRICEPTTAAFVLGSTQRAGDVDEARAAAAGVEVCRRRAGGGGVLVLPGAQIWLDVFVPAGDPLWTPDVGRAFRWLGAAAAAALRASTAGEFSVHEGGLVASTWSSVLCFAGLGPGEVLAGGRKVLGMSQRRDRHGAWFRAMLLLRHLPERSTALLSRSEAERVEATACLREGAGAVEADPALLEAALLEAIAAAG
jgi:lipoate-protein ligase A